MSEDVLALTAQIVSAHVKKNTVDASELPALIRDVFNTLSSLGGAAPARARDDDHEEDPVEEDADDVEDEEEEEVARPVVRAVVPATKSVFQDHIICMECGKKMTMLKRHLMTEHSFTIDQYRERHGLPASYPMVAPNYAETRSTLAKKMGLGKSRSPNAGRKGARRK